MHIGMDRLDKRLAFFISRVGLSSHDDLERVPRVDREQALQVGEQKIRPLVSGHPPREAKERDIGLHVDARDSPDFGNQLAFDLLVC